MPSFRQRPLTWLFFIATGCLDAIALATNNESDLANALALGQLFVASGWLVLGRSHRLARAGVFVAAIGLLTAPDFVIPRLGSRFYLDLTWPHVLGMLIVLGLSTAAHTWLWLAMARLTSRGIAPFQRSDWQFPVAEMFGWMIVVAVASLGLRISNFSLIDSPRQVALGVAMTALAGAMMALVLGDYKEGRRVRGAQVAMAAVVIAVYVGALTTLPADALAVAASALGYTACWTFVMRVDKQAAGTRPERPPCDSPGCSPG